MLQSHREKDNLTLAQGVTPINGTQQRTPMQLYRTTTMICDDVDKIYIEKNQNPLRGMGEKF